MRTWTDSCGAEVPYANKYSHCPECHETFASHAIADAHRVGAIDSLERRCLTVAEMLARTNGKGEPLGWRLAQFEWGTAWRGPLDPRWDTLHSDQTGGSQTSRGLSARELATPPTLVGTQDAAQTVLHEAEAVGSAW